MKKLTDLCRNNLKNRDFGKEAPQIFYSEQETIAARQGSIENEKYGVKTAYSKTDSSGGFGIILAAFVLMILSSFSYKSSTCSGFSRESHAQNANTQPNIIIHKPIGEYAEIDVAASNEIVDVLLVNTSTSQEKKREIAKKVEENLGDYNPMAILGLANFYLEEGVIEKFALYSRFALFRAVVDVSLAKDHSLNDVSYIMMTKVGSLFHQKYPANSRDILKRALSEATKKLLKWTRKFLETMTFVGQVSIAYVLLVTNRLSS